MKIAVVAVTRQGTEMAERTASLLSANGLHQTVLYLPGKFSLLSIEGQRHPFRKPLKELFEELFSEYEAIVCVMALGIVVRLIAPFIKDKTTDPAVVVMDELGRNVISVLSGHWGGANALAINIAGDLGANPVITTSTDVQGLPAIEMLALENGWTIEPFELVKKVNSAIVNGNSVAIYSEVPLEIPGGKLRVKDFAAYSPARKEDGRVVLITNRKAKSFPDGTLFIRPRNLTIGVGCRKGVTANEVLDAVTSAIEDCGRSENSVRSLVSIDIKGDEQGLLEAAEKMNLPIEFFSSEALGIIMAKRKDELSYSKFVENQTGVGGVCEPSAILGAGEDSKIVLPKTKYGKVTIAVAEGSWQ